jgi:hypothetical protein
MIISTKGTNSKLFGREHVDLVAESVHVTVLSPAHGYMPSSRPTFSLQSSSSSFWHLYLIKAIQTVIITKRVKKETVITATSGTAAAGISGNTIHSAIGLTFKDRDGQVQESMPQVSNERRKQLSTVVAQESIDRRRG